MQATRRKVVQNIILIITCTFLQGLFGYHIPHGYGLFFQSSLIMSNETSTNLTITTSVPPEESSGTTNKSNDLILSTNSSNSTQLENTEYNHTNLTQIITLNTNSSNQTNITTPINPIEEKLAEANKRLSKLEDVINEQSNAITYLKQLINDVSSIASQVKQTNLYNKKIMQSIQQLKSLYHKLNYKITSNAIQTESKLNEIHNQIVYQLKTQLEFQAFQLEKEIHLIEKEIEELGLKIKEMQSQILKSYSVCGYLDSCGSCTANPACGWCASTSLCVDGNEKGPTISSCEIYEYNSCTDEKCVHHETCDSCIRDFSCGWCDNPGNPKCMSKEDTDQGKCIEERFVYLMSNRNVCPELTIANFKAVTLKAIKEFESVKKQFNPHKQREKLLRTIMMKRKDKQLTLYKYMRALHLIKNQINHINANNRQFNYDGIDITDIQRQEKEFYEISISWFGMLKEYFFTTSQTLLPLIEDSNIAQMENLSDQNVLSGDVAINQKNATQNITAENEEDKSNNITAVPSLITSLTFMKQSNSTGGTNNTIDTLNNNKTEKSLVNEVSVINKNQSNETSDKNITNSMSNKTSELSSNQTNTNATSNNTNKQEGNATVNNATDIASVTAVKSQSQRNDSNTGANATSSKPVEICEERMVKNEEDGVTLIADQFMVDQNTFVNSFLEKKDNKGHNLRA